MHFFNVKTVEETLALLSEKIMPITEQETIPLHRGLHRIVATDIVAPENVPNFRRSTVDGYAVKASDTYGSSENMPGFLQVIGEVKMGEMATAPLQAGQAMYIPTGGMLPPGSDSVIMIEHVENLDGLLNTFRQVAPHENVVQEGEDVTEGELLLKKGARLRPQDLGALAALGITEVQVYKKLKIGYLSSGDEIVPYNSEHVAIGQVRDINTVTIAGMVEESGHEFVDGGIVPDDVAIFKQRAQQLFAEVDCLVVSGGSSVGAKDYTTDVIESLGEPGIFAHGIAIKPGKPTILSVAKNKPVIGLPGHPTSAMVIFELFGKPIIQRLSGERKKDTPQRVFCKISKNIASAPGRSDYIRVKVMKRDEQWWAEPILGKSSLISTLAQSDGLAEIVSEKEGVYQGELVPVILFS